MKVFIIPGFINYPNKKSYISVKEEFEKRGFEVSIYWPNWWNRPSKILSNFLDFFDNNKSEENLIFSFSLGSMIALKASTMRDVNRLIMCSLSPYFSEDLKKTPFYYKILVLTHVSDFSRNWIFDELVKKFKTPTTLLYGLEEPKYVSARAKEFASARRDVVKEVPIKGAPHNIEDNKYFAAIREAILSL